MFKKFSSDEVSAQNQVKASVQRRIQQSIAVRDPNIMKKLQVDRGAIKFVLAGANIVCPGLTSPGGALDEEVEAETPVAIIALAIGFTKMSAKDIKNNQQRNRGGQHALSQRWSLEDEDVARSTAGQPYKEKDSYFLDVDLDKGFVFYVPVNNKEINGCNWRSFD